MKLQKMDSKQVSQVVVLGILSAGLIGWAGMQILGSGSRPANASTAPQPAGGEQVAAIPDTPGADGSPAPAPAAPGGAPPPAGPACHAGNPCPSGPGYRGLPRRYPTGTPW